MTSGFAGLQSLAIVLATSLMLSVTNAEITGNVEVYYPVTNAKNSTYTLNFNFTEYPQEIIIEVPSEMTLIPSEVLSKGECIGPKVSCSIIDN